MGSERCRISTVMGRTLAFDLSYCAVSLAIIAFIAFYLLPRLRRDTYRADVRRVRDSLFDDMRRNGWDFNDPAYRETREMLNGMIRASNHLSVTAIVLSYVAMSLSEHYQLPKTPEPPLPEGPRGERLRRAKSEAVYLTFRFVFLTGVCGLLIRAFLAVLLAFRFAMRVRDLGMRAAELAVTHAHDITPPPPRTPRSRELSLTP
jgi:hypothetical protein